MQGWVIRIAIIAVIVIGGLIFRDRLSGSAGDLQVGDCFDLPKATQNIKDVQHHPCTESHQAEVFALLKHPAAKGTAPLADAALASYLEQECGPRWVGYVGAEAASAGVLTYNGFFPVDSAWTDGERSVTCITYRDDEASMSSSVKLK